MQLTQRVTQSPNCWFSQERISWIGGIVMALAIGYSAGETQHNEEFVQAKVAPVIAQDQHLKKVVVPVLQAQADCQKARADLATMLAVRAGVSAQALPTCPRASPPAAP